MRLQTEFCPNVYYHCKIHCNFCVLLSIFIIKHQQKISTLYNFISLFLFHYRVHQQNMIFQIIAQNTLFTIYGFRISPNYAMQFYFLILINESSDLQNFFKSLKDSSMSIHIGYLNKKWSFSKYVVCLKYHTLQL